MLAVLLAGGPGTDLAPLTGERPAGMVPVLDRPLMAHTEALLRRQGVERIVAVVHHRPEAVRRWFGDSLEYRTVEHEVDAAAAARLCRDLIGDEPFLVLAGCELTDVDIARLLATHRASGGALTGCVKGGERATIYAAQPEALHSGWVPDADHELTEYWRPVRSPHDLRLAAFELLEGRTSLPVEGERLAEGLILGEGSALDGVAMIEPPVWIGHDVQIGEHTHLQGPLVIGDEATIGDGAQLRGCVILPGSTVPREAVVVDGVLGLVDAWPE